MSRPGARRMQARFASLASLQSVRARLAEIAEDAGLDRPSCDRALHAVHEASVLACRVVDDVAPGCGLCCTIDVVVTDAGVRAVILLPGPVRLDPAQCGEDSLRFVMVFGDEASWSVGPEHQALVVVVRPEDRGALAVRR